MPVYSTPRRIVVRRTAAMGDVLDTTPILARLKDENPGAEIGVQTLHGYVFMGLDVFVNPPWPHYELIDLDMAFEKRNRKVHPIESYSEVAFGDRKTRKVARLHIDRTPFNLPYNLDFDRAIAVHPTKSWPQRTIPWEFWDELVALLVEDGWQVVVIGTEQDHELADAENVFNTRGQLSLQRQAFMIDNCRALVCGDSGIISVAFATRTPFIPLLAMTSPAFMVHERFGRLGWGYYPMMAAVPCVGCQHERDDVNTYFECKWSDERRNACTLAFNPLKVANEATRIARKHERMERRSA